LAIFKWHHDPSEFLQDENQSNVHDLAALLTPADWQYISAGFDATQRISNAVAEALLNPASPFPVPVAHAICSFLKEVAATCSEFRSMNTNATQATEQEVEDEISASFGDKVKGFCDKTEEVIRKLLVAVQGVKKIQATADVLQIRPEPQEAENTQSAETAEQSGETANGSC
jgi:hypothetical protein